jgi:hypothetical protein
MQEEKFLFKVYAVKSGDFVKAIDGDDLCRVVPSLGSS